ncbi:MAG TPA: VWA domain-containing protein [Bryobacteraceae bacterium]|jgi:VWFA-related protein
MHKSLALFFLAAVAIAQEPLYRTGARLVAVDVTVRSNQGPIKGLTKEDFTIQDKGKTQAIAVFSATDSSAPPTKGDPLPAGVVSNRIDSGGETPRTAIAILFDRLNIPRPLDQAAVRTKVLEFLASLKPTDHIGFYSLGTSLTMVQDFDEDAGPLAQAAKSLLGPSVQQAAGAAREQQIEARLKDALTPIQQQDMRVRTATLSVALRTVARHLAGVQGRKNLVWVLSDFPLTYGETSDRRENYESEVAAAANTLGEANIAAYPMDPRGVTTSGSSTSGSDESTINPKEGTLLKGGGGRGGRGGGKGGDDSPTSAVGLSGSETMDAIAKATGGVSYHQTNDVGADVRKVMQDAEVSYTLGFYVDEKALDGKSHDVNVKLAKKPETNGASLRYRKNYLALNPKSAAAQQQRAAMNELVDDAFDSTGIGLMAATAPDPSKPGVHAVQVRLDLRGLQFERRADKWLAAFDLGLAIETPGGPPPMVSNKAMSLSLTDDQLKQGMSAGLIVDNTVPTPPKPAILRVVVQDKGSGMAGSLRLPLNP